MGDGRNLGWGLRAINAKVPRHLSHVFARAWSALLATWRQRNAKDSKRPPPFAGFLLPSQDGILEDMASTARSAGVRYLCLRRMFRHLSATATCTPPSCNARLNSESFRHLPFAAMCARMYEECRQVLSHHQFIFYVSQVRWLKYKAGNSVMNHIGCSPRNKKLLRLPGHNHLLNRQTLIFFAVTYIHGYH